MKRVLEIINENDLSVAEYYELKQAITFKLTEKAGSGRGKRFKTDSTIEYEKLALIFKKQWFVRANNEIMNESVTDPKVDVNSKDLKEAVLVKALQTFDGKWFKRYNFNPSFCQADECYYNLNKDKVSEYKYSKTCFTDIHIVCCDKCKCDELPDFVMIEIMNEFETFLEKINKK